MTIPLLRLRGWECQRRRDENKTFPSKSLFFFLAYYFLLSHWPNPVIQPHNLQEHQLNKQASKKSEGHEREERMDRKAKGGHLRVGRADEDAVAPRGDELVDEEAEPRRVDAVVVRHQQHRRLRRRSSRRWVHASGARMGKGRLSVSVRGHGFPFGKIATILPRGRLTIEI